MESHQPEDTDAIVHGQGVVFLDADRIGGARLLTSMQATLDGLHGGTIATVHSSREELVSVVREWCRSSEHAGRIEFLHALVQHDGVTLVLRVQ